MSNRMTACFVKSVFWFCQHVNSFLSIDGHRSICSKEGTEMTSFSEVGRNERVIKYI